MTRAAAFFFLSLSVACVRPEPATARLDPAAEAGIAFLRVEIPLWQQENHCYSCHNNGDAARVVYLWMELRGATQDTIPDTSAWLSRPAQWEHNGGEGVFSDQRLARVQFSAALVSAAEAGFGDPDALLEAGQRLAADQLPSGAWQDAPMLGSPITYGDFLATQVARDTLLRMDARRYQEEIAAADRWFREATVQTVMDAAATLLAGAQREHCMELIRSGESPKGGWGPYVSSAPEVFDTALVLLALVPFGDDPEVAAMIQRGRRYLVATQEADGGWPETTRPPGNRSYAHRISTSGWATQALLRVREQRG